MVVKLFFFEIVFILFASWINADTGYICKFETYDASLKGTISSPFYGQKPYPVTIFCQNTIVAPEGQKIKITFKDFDLYPSKECEHRLSVKGRGGRTLAFLCGNQLPRPILSDEGENLYLYFVSDFYGSGRGFLLEYESGPDLELCETGESVCGNRNCFKPEKKCDGVDDCGDGTDEENCNYPLVVLNKYCGNPKIKPKTPFDRIVGGEEAVPNSWPWQVSLNKLKGEPSKHFCGGTLINAQWVMTAAHCVTGEYNGLKILVGAHNLLNKTSYQQTRRSVQVIAYPDLTEEKIKDYKIDLALIKMNAPVFFNDGVQAACLPDFDFKLPVNWQCYSTGWGETRGSGSSHNLKQLLVSVRPEKDCYGMYEKGAGVCVFKERQSVCHGDSGGPLHCKVGDKWYVLGASAALFSETAGKWDIISRCAVTLSQAGYTGTLGKVNWIQETIQKYT